MFRAARSILKTGLRPLLRRYDRQLAAPRETQEKLLRQLIAGLAATDYGRAHNIHTNDDYRTFAARFPVARYDDLEEWIERQQKYEAQALVSEPVLFYEKTSGSSGAAKLIPYTRSLKASFNRMFFLWLGDLLENGPRFHTGRAYLSISPAFRTDQRTTQGVRIGLDDDTEYLSPWTAQALKPFLTVSPIATQIQNPDAFKLAVSTMLLADPRLEIISVWNASLLDLLLEFIGRRRQQILPALHSGVLKTERGWFRFRPAAASRIKLLEADPICWEKLWPGLKLISCWTNAHAAAAARSLASKFPNVMVQGKGLLATEAPLTIPMINAGGFTPLPSEVFYEFLDPQDRIWRLHELAQDHEYEVILTQKGGLTRYRIGDRVRVTGRYQNSPCLEFLGRADAVSDLVGEKLHEAFVQRCLERFPTRDAFQTLVPMTPKEEAWHYLLLIDRAPFQNARFEAELEMELFAGYHYRNARLLGQLASVKIRIVPHLREVYYRYFISKGMKWGDIKHRYLIRDLDDAAGLTALLASTERSALPG